MRLGCTAVMALVVGATSARADVLVYLNREATTISPGVDDARLGRSSLVTEPLALAGWDADAALWRQTVDCVRRVFEPYAIGFTEIDPGDVPHVEAVFGGRPTLFGLSNNVGGVAPYRGSCESVDNAMTFTFTDVLPADARTVCETAAQELAHSFGLDHVMLPSDLMSYLPYEGERAFQDRSTPCGEREARPCACGSQQSSAALLAARLGVKPGYPMPATMAGLDEGGCRSTRSGSLLPGFLVVAFGVQRRRAHR